MEKKPTYYKKDILRTFDYVFDQIFLSDNMRFALLGGYDPITEKFGKPPKDVMEFGAYCDKHLEYILNLKVLHKPVLDRTILNCIRDWPNPNPALRYQGLTKEQLYVLDARIGEARLVLKSKKYPRKLAAEELDKDLDWFYPMMCLMTLLDT